MIFNGKNFFLVDLNIDHDDDVSGWNQRQLYFDNKLGINNLKLLKKKNIHRGHRRFC